MKKVEITLRDIKSIKSLMDQVDSLKDSSFTVNGYSSNYNGKEALIEYREKEIEKNILIAANLLKVDYNTVIDMCYDLEFAKEILKN